MRRAFGAASIALLLAFGQGVGADARAAVEAYVARVASAALEDLTVEQTFTLYHPGGRLPSVTGTQRLLLKLPGAQRLEQTIEGQREIRVTVGDRIWVRQQDGRTFEAPPSEGRRERMLQLITVRRDASDLLAEWRTFGIRADVVDETRVAGRPVTVIGARASDRDRPSVWIDPEYGIVRFVSWERLPDGNSLVDVGFGDHRPLLGQLFYPYRQEVFADGKLLLRVIVHSVQPNTQPSKDLFDPDVLKRRG